MEKEISYFNLIVGKDIHSILDASTTVAQVDEIKRMFPSYTREEKDNDTIFAFRMSFEEFMKQTNKICEREMEIDLYSLIDWDFVSAYEDGFSPRQAYNQFMEEVYPDYCE